MTILMNFHPVISQCFIYGEVLKNVLKEFDLKNNI